MKPTDNHRGWAERSGEFSPTYYAQIGPNATSESLVDLCERYASTDAAILEVGCSSGRHLAHLLENGFEELSGIDINDESFTVMDETYPQLAATGSFRTGAIEEAVAGLPDNAFDVVYSVETLQHIHPDDEWVFKELARVTADLLIIVENEGADPESGREGNVNYINDDFPLYYRNWKRIFTEIGLVHREFEQTKRDTVRVFQVP